MKEKEVIKFTTKDIACEALGQLIVDWDLLGAIEIIKTGRAYNKAKDGGDPEEIAQACMNLHHELFLFKKNFLNRGKPHW